MKIGFNLPPFGGGTWTEEAAKHLVGQEIVWDNKPAIVVDCHLAGDGSLRGTVEVKESLV
jgi:hypothetical protein